MTNYIIFTLDHFKIGTSRFVSTSVAASIAEQKIHICCRRGWYCCCCWLVMCSALRTCNCCLRHTFIFALTSALGAARRRRRPKTNVSCKNHKFNAKCKNALRFVALLLSDRWPSALGTQHSAILPFLTEIWYMRIFPRKLVICCFLNTLTNVDKCSFGAAFPFVLLSSFC